MCTQLVGVDVLVFFTHGNGVACKQLRVIRRLSIIGAMVKRVVFEINRFTVLPDYFSFNELIRVKAVLADGCATHELDDVARSHFNTRMEKWKVDRKPGRLALHDVDDFVRGGI